MVEELSRTEPDCPPSFATSGSGRSSVMKDRRPHLQSPEDDASSAPRLGDEQPRSDEQLVLEFVHDFRNIMTGLLGYCHLLREMQELSPAAKECVDEIYTAATQGAQLLQQFDDPAR